MSCLIQYKIIRIKLKVERSIKCNRLLNFKDINTNLKLQNWPVLIKYPTNIYDFKSIQKKKPDSEHFQWITITFQFLSWYKSAILSSLTLGFLVLIYKILTISENLCHM